MKLKKFFQHYLKNIFPSIMNHVKKHLYIIAFFLLLSVLVGYLSWLQAVIALWISLCVYGVIFYILHIVWKTIRGKSINHIRDFFVNFLYRVSIWISLVGILFGWFTYYQNDINPAEMPLYSLSNGSKEIRFQTMSHIGSKSFYEWVKNDIAKWKQQWFVLFYEWVRPWSEENMKDFNVALWVDFNPSIYENFSKLYGVEHQRNPEFLWISNNKDFNIDLDIDTIMSIYNEKVWGPEESPGDMMQRKETQIADISGDIIEELASLNEKELAVMRYMNKSVLNLLIKNESFRDMIVERFGNQDLFQVILEDRNTHLVENLSSSEYQNIFVIYGLMHFEGVLEMLQAEDPKWKIQSVEYKRLID